MYAATAHTQVRPPQSRVVMASEPVCPDAPTEVPAPPREKPKPKPTAQPGRLVATSVIPPGPHNITLSDEERTHAWRAHLEAMLTEE